MKNFDYTITITHTKPISPSGGKERCSLIPEVKDLMEPFDGHFGETIDVRRLNLYRIIGIKVTPSGIIFSADSPEEAQEITSWETRHEKRNRLVGQVLLHPYYNRGNKCRTKYDLEKD